MKIINIFIAVIAYLILLNNARSQETISPTGTLTFKIQNAGLTLLVDVPVTAKSLSDLVITCKLVNNTGNDFHYQCNAGLFHGMTFKLKDANGNSVPFTHEGKDNLTGTMSMATWFETIKSGNALIVSFPITRFFQVEAMGKYSLYLRWREEKLGEDTTKPEPVPKLQLTGSFLLQSSANGISVSLVK